MKTEHDSVNPKHYIRKFELIEVIEEWNLNFYRANVVKYIARAGFKDKNTELEDLMKAKWYLDREIARMSKDEVKEVYQKAKKEPVSCSQFVCKCGELISMSDPIIVDNHGHPICERC